MNKIRLWSAFKPSGVIPTIFSDSAFIWVQDLAEANYSVFHQELRNEVPQELGSDLIDLYNISKQHTKKMLIFMIVDRVGHFDGFEQSLIFRTSLLKSAKLANEYLLPYLWDDFQPRAIVPALNTKPKIAFCGAITSHERKLQLEYIYNQCGEILQPEFIIRQLSWGRDSENPREEFWLNMKNCEFAACPRGAGNFSIRFYQAMSAGRIPVLINTDMILPFEDQIPWNEIAVIADSAEELHSKLKEFINSKDLIQAQVACREYFEQYLSLDYFSQYLYKMLANCPSTY